MNLVVFAQEGGDWGEITEIKPGNEGFGTGVVNMSRNCEDGRDPEEAEEAESEHFRMW